MQEQAGLTHCLSRRAITNYPDHHHLETQVPDAGATIEGFKVDDYRAGRQLTLQQKIEMRERNPEIEALLASIKEHVEVPATFEGEIPDLPSNRLLIGRQYRMDDGFVGTLEDACVMEINSEVYLAFKMDDGRRVIYSNHLSEAEFAAWKRYPETFFGEIRQTKGSSIEDPIEVYDMMKSTYKNTPKEKLLEFMGVAGALVPSHLQALGQAELLEIYVQGMVNLMVQHAGPQEIPVHIQRLNRLLKYLPQ